MPGRQAGNLKLGKFSGDETGRQQGWSPEGILAAPHSTPQRATEAGVNSTATGLAAAESPTRQRRAQALLILLPALALAILVAIGVGAVDIGPLQVVSIL